MYILHKQKTMIIEYIPSHKLKKSEKYAIKEKTPLLILYKEFSRQINHIFLFLRTKYSSPKKEIHPAA